MQCGLVCVFAAVLTTDGLECQLHVEGEKGAVQKTSFLCFCVQYLLFCQDMKDKTSLSISILLKTRGTVQRCWCQKINRQL